MSDFHRVNKSQEHLPRSSWLLEKYFFLNTASAFLPPLLMTESLSAETGCAWCGSLNFWLRLWLSFSLSCISFIFTSAPGLPRPCAGVCLQPWSLTAHQDHSGCWCAVAAWAVSPPGQMPSLRNDQPMCSESSCQQLCVLAVSVCTPMGWKPSLPLCLKGTPGPF